MRPLGLLGAALGGAPPFAGLGTGTPSPNTYLRGDGVWAALSVAPFMNRQTFTANGTFTVPVGVTIIMVVCIGGGGGGGGSGGGSSGGATSFGSIITAGQGSGAGGGTDAAGSTSASTFDATLAIATAGTADHIQAASGNYGKGGAGYAGGNSSPGGAGGAVLALCTVTPGAALSVTIGAGGNGGGGGSAGSPGLVIVRY